MQSTVPSTGLIGGDGEASAGSMSSNCLSFPVELHRLKVRVASRCNSENPRQVLKLCCEYAPPAVDPTDLAQSLPTPA